MTEASSERFSIAIASSATNDPSFSNVELDKCITALEALHCSARIVNWEEAEGCTFGEYKATWDIRDFVREAPCAAGLRMLTSCRMLW